MQAGISAGEWSTPGIARAGLSEIELDEEEEDVH
jgi:hypothetical protein